MTDPDDVAWGESLMSKYVRGGVGALIEALREAQEAA
jgi:phytoene dehydrogenase-like protein